MSLDIPFYRTCPVIRLTRSYLVPELLDVGWTLVLTSNRKRCVVPSGAALLQRRVEGLFPADVIDGPEDLSLVDPDEA